MTQPKDAVAETPAERQPRVEERISVASNWTLVWWRFASTSWPC